MGSIFSPVFPLESGQTSCAPRFPSFTGQAGEAQVTAQFELGCKNNLARMVGEMFRDVPEGLESRDAKPLDRISARQVAWSESLNEGGGLEHGAAQSGE